jgi:hypothetical protein
LSGGQPPREGKKGFRCPYCDSEEPPEIRNKISTAGWILFVVLLIFCFSLCFISLFITEEVRYCHECGTPIG